MNSELESESYRKNLHPSNSIKLCFVFVKSRNQTSRESPKSSGGGAHECLLVRPPCLIQQAVRAQWIAVVFHELEVGVRFSCLGTLLHLHRLFES